MFGRSPGLHCCKKYGFLKRLFSLGLRIMPPCVLTDCGTVIQAVRKDDLGKRFEPGTFTLRSSGAVTRDILFKFCSCVRDLRVQLGRPLPLPYPGM